MVSSVFPFFVSYPITPTSTPFLSRGTSSNTCRNLRWGFFEGSPLLLTSKKSPPYYSSITNETFHRVRPVVDLLPHNLSLFRHSISKFSKNVFRPTMYLSNPDTRRPVHFHSSRSRPSPVLYPGLRPPTLVLRDGTWEVVRRRRGDVVGTTLGSPLHGVRTGLSSTECSWKEGTGKEKRVKEGPRTVGQKRST